jgi:hypothetical protein
MFRIKDFYCHTRAGGYPDIILDSNFRQNDGYLFVDQAACPSLDTNDLAPFTGPRTKQAILNAK